MEPVQATEGPPRMVVVLCGPSGAGKTTAARTSGLTVYDRDDPQWRSEAQFVAALAALRSDPYARAVIIRSGATSSARAFNRSLTGATHVYVVLAPVKELERRIRERDRRDKVATLSGLRQWFRRFDRADGVRDFPGWPAVYASPLHTSGVRVNSRSW